MQRSRELVVPSLRMSVLGFFLYVLAAATTASTDLRPAREPVSAVIETDDVADRTAVGVESGRLHLLPQDTFLNLDNRNYSSDTLLGTYTWPDYRVANAILMRFDLSAVPAGAVVEKAVLRLALVGSDAAAETYTITAHKLLAKNLDIAKATGYTADGVAGWTPNTSCYNSVPLAQADVSTAYDTRAIDQVAGLKDWDLTTMVHEWLSDPASNRGVLLNSDPSKPRDRYRFFASVEHADPNLRPSLEVVFSAPDVSAPSVTVSAPVAGSDLSDTVAVSATATDDVGVAGVQLHVNGTPLGPELTAHPYTFDWDTTTISDGDYVLTALARDAAGNRAAAAPVTVSVKNGLLFVAPQGTYLNLDALSHGREPVFATYTWPDYKVANAILLKADLSALPPQTVVQDAKLVLALVESDTTTTSTYSISAHRLLGKNPVIANATGYTADGVTSWTPNSCCSNSVPLAQADISAAYDRQVIDKVPGFKVWTITQMVQEWVGDPSANFGMMLNSDATTPRDRYRFFASMEHPDSRLRPFLRIKYGPPPPDTTSPTVSLTSPAPQTYLSGLVTLAASATDDVGVAGVQLELNGAPLGPELVAEPYVFDWNTSILADGDYTLTGRARDAAGNVASSTEVRVKKDKSPPSITTTAPASGTTVGSTITVSASSSDNDAVAGVQFKLDGANLGGEDISAPYSVSWNTTTASAGSHSLTAVARDAAGNTATSAAITVTVANAPTIASFTPASGPIGTSVSLSGTNFTGATAVRFNGVGALFTVTSATSIQTTVPSGATTGAVTVTTAAGTATSSTAFTVSTAAPAGGLASHYPGDVGIENDANVVFIERFDQSSLANLFGGWTDIMNGSAMSFSTDAPAGSPVGRSLQIPWSSGNSGGHLYKQLSPGVDDTLYVRYYVKYPTDNGYTHTGIWMGGNNPPLGWPNPQAGVKPSGSDRFIAGAEPNMQTGSFDHYDYWMNMRQSADGKYWGNVLLNDPNVTARAGQWMCVEHMVKLNNPTDGSNGEHAIWLDGVKVSHLGPGFPNGFWSGGVFTQASNGSPFEGFRWRSDANLDLNWIWLQVYATVGSGNLKFAHVVAATTYIGCLSSAASADTTPPTVSMTSPTAGQTVSGTITVSADASDNSGVAGVQFRLNGINLGSEDTTAPYTRAWDTSGVANGTHTLTAVARDAAGNTSTSLVTSVTVTNETPAGSAEGVLFESNWDTATGMSAAAVTDGGRWPNYWEFNNGSDVQLLSVVSGGVNGHNALRVQQRGSTFAANLQLDDFLPQSQDYYLRFYMKNDDTSGAGDHIVTVDTYQYANLTFMRKYAGASSWRFVMSLYGCGFTYPIGHWGPAQALANGQWYRFEYHVDYIDSTHVRVHPRVYDAAGTLIMSDADFRQEDWGSASWNGRSDWTLASYYAAGHSFCVQPGWVNDFGLGNNGQQGAADTGRYWYFAGVQLRKDTWPGPVAPR